MPVDHIRYDLLTQQALRAVVRRVLGDVAKSGSLPGEHHFYVTFDTRAPGVKMSARLRAQYPEEMTVVLQHQFWDLTVTDSYFEVALSFNGISEKLHVPLDTVKGFFDPSVQFGLQFETVTEAQTGPREVAAEQPVEEPKTPRLKRKPAEPEPPAAIGPATPTRADKAEVKKPEAPKETQKPALVTDTDKDDPDKPSGGAEVVRLDRFRKK
ncbi:MAG TPA: ClpXP protease specificity-enhancing factor SspB [Xanthobacteraceae bacterium]|nr:ClpXP protease specificity-enhancing factor SspB [Xanthobacteraceae bacterium]